MSKIEGRVFIVGAPRSGTTLLQSLLAAHPQITSFPESHVFEELILCRRPWSWIWVNILGLARPRAIVRFRSFVQSFNQEPLQDLFPKKSLFINQYALAFIKVLDTVTEKRGKSIWLEKTPKHLHCIDYIESLIPDAKFVHIIRNGADVVASQYDAARKNPGKSWNHRRNVDRCTDLWIEDVRISIKHLSKSNHTVVKYEQLVQEPHSVLTQTCKFLEIPFNEAMLQDYTTVAKQIIQKHELPWKKSVVEPLRNVNGKKFYELFDERQRQGILERLSQVSEAEITQALKTKLNSP